MKGNLLMLNLHFFESHPESRCFGEDLLLLNELENFPLNGFPRTDLHFVAEGDGEALQPGIEEL